MSSNQELALQIEGLSFEYQVGLPVLWNFDLDVTQGSICGLLGRNGCGKTTLLQCLYGMLEPEEGICRVLGHTPFHEVVPLRQRVGYVPQTPQFDLTRSAEEQLALVRELDDQLPATGSNDEMPEGFYPTLKRLVIVGYFTTETGASQTGYRITPGTFQGCVAPGGAR